ncbi:MAG: NCS2 family permease [Deltaproteobacteria bacterium]|nr:NCS2 family permease [Deltaproteobacteria bacterium]
MLETLFSIRAQGSTPARETIGGLTTFLTMAYIVVVNPIFLSAAGVPLEGALLATCLSAAFGTLLMAFMANYPIALAPGMGLNAFFAYTICLGAGIPWQTALGLIFWAGIAFVLLTITGARAMIVRAVPPVLRFAGAVGIGFFIAFIGLQQGGLVQGNPHTLLSLGDLRQAPIILSLVGLAITFALLAKGVRTAIFWGLLSTLVLGLVTGLVARPEALFSVPQFDLPGFEIDLLGALRLEYLPLVLVILFFDIFDTLGTLLGIAHEGDFLEEGELPRLDRAMAADSAGTVVGALFGTSTVTSYIESGAGVGVGARTGFANVVTGSLFLLAPFLAPVIVVVGQGAEGSALTPVTAPALIAVGSLMVGAVREVDWSDFTEAAPAFVTALTMPLSFNISHGLAAGIVTFVVVKLSAGRRREVHWLLIAIAALILLRYALLPV